jgi:hypothetical protein
MGMVYLGLKRDKSELTFDDVRRLRLSDVDFDIQESADNADPTQPVESSESESAKSAPED